MSYNETVTVLKTEYIRLLEAERKLAALKACGVDNWEGYGDAMREYLKEEE